MARLATLLVAALFTGWTPAGQAPDAARVLADMRQALGGDAIDAVRAFSVEGTEKRIVGQFTPTNRTAWLCVLPDRFIRVRRFGSGIVLTSGFSGDALVNVRPTTRSVIPPPPESSRTPPAPRPPASIADLKREYSRFVIAMLGITATYPYDATYVSRESLDRRTVHVLALKASDDHEARLYVDTVTHLPAMISWMGLPELSMINSPVVVLKDGQLIEPRLDLTERRLYFSGYKKAGGLNWPHRLKEVVARRTVAEIKLEKFKIDSQIDPKRVDPST